VTEGGAHRAPPPLLARGRRPARSRSWGPTEKPTPSVSLFPSLCLSATSPLAEGECTNLSWSFSRENSVRPALGVALLIMARRLGRRPRAACEACGLDLRRLFPETWQTKTTPIGHAAGPQGAARRDCKGRPAFRGAGEPGPRAARALQCTHGPARPGPAEQGAAKRGAPPSMTLQNPASTVRGQSSRQMQRSRGVSDGDVLRACQCHRHGHHRSLQGCVCVGQRPAFPVRNAD
jgi:hypothetical protein